MISGYLRSPRNTEPKLWKVRVCASNKSVGQTLTSARDLCCRSFFWLFSKTRGRSAAHFDSMERHAETLNSSYLHAKLLEQIPKSQKLIGLLVALAFVTTIFSITKHKREYRDGLVTVNKHFSWEPAYFARLRWITKAQQILEEADYKVSRVHDVALV